MSRRESKTITLVVPGRGATTPFTVTASTTLPDLLKAARCPDWYCASLTRKGPAISFVSRRPFDVVQHNGKLYLSSPIKTEQMDLPFLGAAAAGDAPSGG